MVRRLVVGFVGGLVVAGCAGMSPSQVGQTTGGLAGAIIAPGVGMPLGALVGTLAGLVVEDQMDKVRQKTERASLNQQLQTPSSAPGRGAAEPTPGQPTRVWVDESVQQGRLIVGHFEIRNVS